MKRIFTLLLLFVASITVTKGQTFAWAKKTGTNQQELATLVDYDMNGNVYSAGTYQAQLYFTSLYSVPWRGGNDVFLSAFSKNGTFRWGKGMGSVYDDSQSALSVDMNGNVYFFGVYQDQLIIGTDTINASGLSGFFMKMDSLGNILFLKNTNFTPSNIFYDNNGNLKMCIFLAGTIVVDNDTIVPLSSYDILIMRFDTNGNLMDYVQNIGPVNASVKSLEINSEGDVYICGEYTGTAVIGNDTLISEGHEDVFIARYDTSGIAAWATSVGKDSTDYVRGLAIDSLSNAYITGIYIDKIQIGDTLFNALDEWDVYTAKYDSSGNFIWARNAGGTGYDFAMDIASENSGEIVISGYYCCGGTNFYAGTQYVPYTFSSLGDIFVVKYDTYGDVIWIQHAGTSGCGVETWGGLKIDQDKNVYVTGRFTGSPCYFGSTTLYGNGVSWDGLTLKLTEDVNGIKEFSQRETLNIYPNPASQSIAVDFSGFKNSDVSSLHIINSLGKEVLSKSFGGDHGFTKEINLSKFPAGLYIVTVKYGQQSSSQKLIIE